MLQGNENDEAKPFLEENHLEASHNPLRIKRRNQTFVVLPWVLSAISWTVTIYLLFQRLDSDPTISNACTVSAANNQAQGVSWSTDFAPLRSSVVYEKRTFTGALLYDEVAKRFYRNISSEEPMYVGPPSEAIDAAWEELFKHEWSPMTEEEAAPFRPTLKTFNDQFLFEPDMYHSLHCLNEVRKRVDVEYYSQPAHAGFKIDQEDWDRIHIDHCLDQLRQTIMCSGDLSPVPLYSWDGAPLGIGRGTEHTCRKLDPIKEWIDQRHREMPGPLEVDE